MVNLAGIIILGGIPVVGGLYTAGAYLAGGWPFTRIKENVYEITQWFTGHRGPALKGPRTAWYVRPFIKKVGEKGSIETVSGKIRDRDSSLHFRTNDNFEGDQAIQYNYLIPDEKSAKKFYWDVGKDITLIDEIVHAKISEEIGKRNADDLPKEELTFLKRVQEELGKTDKENLLYKRYGVIVTNIVSKAPDFVPGSQRILSIIPEANRKAEADKIEAEAEKKIAKSHAEATQLSIASYDRATRKTLKLAGIVKGESGYAEAYIKQYNIYFKTDNYQRYGNVNVIVDDRESGKDGPITPIEKKGPNGQNYKSPKNTENSSLEEKTSESEVKSETPKETIEDILGE